MSETGPGPRPERLTGFGSAQVGVSRVLRPESSEELRELFSNGRDRYRTLGLRAGGRSYGDAAINDGGAVLDLSRLDSILDFDMQTGIVDVEPGVTIDQLWRRTLPAGFWPQAVPGTSFATVGGIVSMNAHGKNCFRVGPTGDHVEELDVLLPTGEAVTCGPEQRPELFTGVIAGAGLLGCVTRVRLRLKRVHSGFMNVAALPARGIDEMFDIFERELPTADYVVGWCDALAPERALGRGVVHRANHLQEGEDRTAWQSMTPEAQDLSPRMVGVFPRSQLWRVLRTFQNRAGMRGLNWGKHLAHRFDPRRPHRWLHSEFGFIFDYVPDWERMYGSAGLIQVQPFVPADAAREVFADILRMAKRSGLPPFLVVMKRHRPDGFLLSHGLDGYSLAMDFPVRRRARLWALAREIQELVIGAGGRFYFAKDSTLTAEQTERMLPAENLRRFAELKRKCDPDAWLQTDLARRVLPDLY